jgi:DNA polymerase III subunit gamma/tau
MENFVVSARKYRPATFASVVGQEHITITLKNAIANNHLAHAFLFCGPRGVGKTTCARILAKTINCQNLGPETEACNLCDNCLGFNNNASFNVHELDAASNNSVEDIRSLVEQVRYAPQTGKYKIYIIDEVHMLSNTAFNAFLKTLEEPPSYAIFILATTEKHKIIPTILSRCQIFDFNRIQQKDIAGHLAYIAKKEDIDAEPEALNLIAQKADGGLRDALSIFDLISTFSAGRAITYKSTIENLHILDYDYYFKITDALRSEDLSTVLLTYDEILRKGFDGHNFIAGLCEHFRNLMVCKDASTLSLLEVSEAVQAKYASQAQACSVSFLLTALGIATQADTQFKSSKNQRLLVELALMKMCYIEAAINLGNGNPLSGGEKKKPEPDLKPVTAPIQANPGPITEPKNTFGNSLPGPNPQPEALPAKAIAEKPNAAENNIPTIENSLAEYVAQLKAGNNISSAILLEAKPIKMVNASDAIITLQGNAQVELFVKLREPLRNWLSSQLGIADLTLQAEAGEVALEKVLYSSEEKFFHLVEINPVLNDLKLALGLELER